MSRELFRLVGVWSGCWVVRDAQIVQIVQIVISCALNKLVNFVGTLIV
jgi:hypothetical protein